MRACHNVRIDSPQLSGDVWDQLDVWFKEGATNLATSAARETPAVRSSGRTSMRRRSNVVPQAASTQQTPAQAPPQFKVKGQTLACEVVAWRPADRTRNLNLDGDVHFEGDGMSLTGPNVDVNAETNVMRINGPGQMQFPLGKVLHDPTQTAAGVLTVDWRNYMEIAGRTIIFNGPVVATTTQHRELNTAVMKVTLDRAIRFTDTRFGRSPAARKIQCSGGVLMKNRSFDQQQQQISFEQLQVTRLGVNIQSGAVDAGPGWFNSVNYQSADMLGSQFAAPGKTPANAVSPA